MTVIYCYLWRGFILGIINNYLAKTFRILVANKIAWIWVSTKDCQVGLIITRNSARLRDYCGSYTSGPFRISGVHNLFEGYGHIQMRHQNGGPQWGPGTQPPMDSRSWRQFTLNIYIEFLHLYPTLWNSTNRKLRVYYIHCIIISRKPLVPKVTLFELDAAGRILAVHGLHEGCGSYEVNPWEYTWQNQNK